MGLNRLRAFLRRHQRIALDPSVFIYQLEGNPRYVQLTDAVFAWVEHPAHEAITSTITMLELLVQTYRDSSEPGVNEYCSLLTTYPHLRWIPLDLEVADFAARVRATDRLRAPDAVQAACAIRAQATGLVTNDPSFERVELFEVLVLDHFLSQSGTVES